MNLNILYAGSFINKDGISETIFLLVTNIYVNIPMVMKVKKQPFISFRQELHLATKIKLVAKN